MFKLLHGSIVSQATRYISTSKKILAAAFDASGTTGLVTVSPVLLSGSVTEVDPSNVGRHNYKCTHHRHNVPEEGEVSQEG